MTRKQLRLWIEEELKSIPSKVEQGSLSERLKLYGREAVLEEILEML